MAKEERGTADNFTSPALRKLVQGPGRHDNYIQS